jgi:D-alanyl-D-alanine carboxypeptidase
LFTPGSGFHYSNIGYDVLGLIASRAGGKPLADLYRERIFEPLGLDTTAYDPQGPIQGPHARGYAIEPDGTRFDASDWHAGVGAEGGIVSNAEETARFLLALLQGKLVDVRRVEAMKGDSLWFGGASTGCAGQAYGWSGGGNGYKTDVWVDGNGTRVAVLLLNARHWDTAQPVADATAHDAMARLFCRA